MNPARSDAAGSLVQQLLSGRLDKGRQAFAGLCDANAQEVRASALQPSTDAGRVPLSDGSKLTCLAPGTLVAGYAVSFHVRGGMSLCYLGKLGSDTRFIKEVSLTSEEAALALRKEFLIMRGLKHPNIVRAHQLFELGGYLYLVMDYVEGVSLATYATRETPEPASEERLLTWALQLCDTFNYLHSQQPPIIYRDLKPANIVLTPTGQLFLIDFGLARTYKVGQLRDTQALGTFATASPEHFNAQTSTRSDLFTLGATLFLLANPGFKPEGHPLPSPSRGKAAAQFRFPPLRQLNPAYSEGFEQLLKTCLEASPEARWSSARVMSAEVQKLLERLHKGPATAGPEEPSAPDPEGGARIPDLPKNLAAFARQLAVLLDEGKALTQGLQTLASQCEVPALAQVLESVAERARAGQSLSSALTRFPKVFSSEFVDQIVVGETKNRLPAALRDAAGSMEKEDLARRTRSASAARDSNPLQESSQAELEITRARRKKALRALALVALASGSATVWAVDGLAWALWLRVLMGFGVSLTVAFAAIFVSAVRDARQMRVVSRARELLEDAWTNHALGETEKAEKQLTEALLLSLKKLGPGHLTTLTSLHSLANLCRQRRQFDLANEYYQQAEAIYERILPANHVARAHLHHHWSMNLTGQKDLDKALVQIEQSLAIWSQHAETHPLELAEVQFYKGQLHFAREDNQQASEQFARALALQNAKLGMKSPLVHATMSFLTRVQVRMSRFEECEGPLTMLLGELEQDPEPDYAALAEANMNMGLIRLEQDRGREAEPYFLKALQLLQHYVGPNERLLQIILHGYRRIYGARAEQEAGLGQLISVFVGEREKIRQAMERQPEWFNIRDHTGWGPIQWATFIGRDDIVKWLLARGADTGYDSTHVMGPLHVACAWNQPEALIALLEKEPDVNASGPGGWTLAGHLAEARRPGGAGRLPGTHAFARSGFEEPREDRGRPGRRRGQRQRQGKKRRCHTLAPGCRARPPGQLRLLDLQRRRPGFAQPRRSDSTGAGGEEPALPAGTQHAPASSGGPGPRRRWNGPGQSG